MRISVRRARLNGTAIAVVAVTLGMLRPAAAQSPESGPPKPPAKDFTQVAARPVIEVAAGDTIVVRMNDRDVTVRLIGVHIARTGADTDDAKAFTSRLLAGESVYVEPDPQWPRQDADGRLWAYVYRAPDGLLLNLELVRQGYARVSAGGEFEHQKLLIAYQRVAQQNGKGLWGPRGAAHAAVHTRPAAGPPSSAPATDEHTVYVTPHGRKYHRPNCQHVRSGATPLSVEEAKKRGYTPCSRCKPSE